MTTSNGSILRQFPPMGIYEVLFDFLDSSGSYLGEPGTHPWAQGFPMTTQLPGGPEIPSSIEFDALDLKYPPATGTPALLEAIRDYYNHFYDAGLDTDNIAVFAGGRPALFATLTFLQPEFQIVIEETEYTPYYDVLKLLGRDCAIIPSSEANGFRPSIADYEAAEIAPGASPFVLKSNPCNPTGVTWTGDALEKLVKFCSADGRGGIIAHVIDHPHKALVEHGKRFIKHFLQGRDRGPQGIRGLITKLLDFLILRFIDRHRGLHVLGTSAKERPSNILFVRSVSNFGADRHRDHSGRK